MGTLAWGGGSVDGVCVYVCVGAASWEDLKQLEFMSEDGRKEFNGIRFALDLTKGPVYVNARLSAVRAQAALMHKTLRPRCLREKVLCSRETARSPCSG
eukprot:m.203640 g.203640  ORF g.203640 m.203640 type:complete len:99 (-) comp18856_c0_seq2:920-1216(-)